MLELLRLVGTRVGIPSALLTPMLQAYAQPRAVLLAGALAPERTPSAGLAPGCPRATDLLAIVIFMYTSTMEESTHSVKSRPYVDDITSDYSGPDPIVAVEVVSDMVRFTHQFADDLGFKPNLVKSKRFSTDPGIRAILREMPGPPVAMSFLDLSVVQNLGNKASVLNAKRIDSGLGKLWRTSVLSMPLRRRGLFVAASGVPAAMYGIAAAPLSNSALLSLSAVAFSAV